MPLTIKQVEYAKPKSKTKARRLSDGGGMYLEAAPSGGKWWRLKYRFGGKEKRISLGTFPEVSLKQARERREDARRLLANGVDPSEQRKAEKHAAAMRNANSFESVAREWHAKREHTLVAHHATDVLRRLESNLFPAIGSKPIAEVTAPMLLAAVRKIEARGARDLAHRVLQVASQVFRYGVATGRCEQDPAPALRGALAPHVKRNQAAVSADDLPELLRKIEEYAELGEKDTALGLRLLALTFVRTGELIGAEWSEIDLEAGLWIIPAQRMKMRLEHVVPLSHQALATLRELALMAGGSRYVFRGRNPDKSISNNTLLYALYRLGYKGKMTGHGFRAVASTMLNEAGFRPDVIERQLAHSERNEVRGAYNRAEYLPERRSMMQMWADTLDALRQGADVVPIKRRA